MVHNAQLPAWSQVVGGSAFVVGEAWKPFQSRHLSLKRQLLQLWLGGELPEGLDVSRLGRELSPGGWVAVCSGFEPALTC